MLLSSPVLTPNPLLPHPAVHAGAAVSLSAGAELRADGLHLAYRLAGDLAGLVVPETCPPGPADELWRHTCCEAFVAGPGQAGYREFNFSPSGQWAAYAFAGYRERIGWNVPAAPTIAVSRGAGILTLAAFVPAALLPDVLPNAGPLRLGLTAVLEAAGGSLDYRALAHCGERPDFHLAESFVLALEPVS